MMIECGYDARKESELPVLVSFIDRKRFPPPQATFLDIILYSREQIEKENGAMGSQVRFTAFSEFMSCLTYYLHL